LPLPIRLAYRRDHLAAVAVFCLAGTAPPLRSHAGDGGYARARRNGADSDETGSAEPGHGQDRLDVATLETAGPGEAARVVFHEAKHFTNKELRARADRERPVVGQMERYRKTLLKHADAISRSYRDVCRALVRIDAMRRIAAESVGHAPPPPLDPRIVRVAQDGILPEIDPEPRPVVFGFDKDQRDGPVYVRVPTRS
jgi:hypothetical protein